MLDDLFQFKLGGDIHICPGKNLAVYVENQADRVTNGYQTHIMQIWKGKDPVLFTQGPKDHSPRFSPDGQWLAFISKRSNQDQIWIMPTQGGEAQQLTFIDGGIDSFIWAPDSFTLYATAFLTEDGIRKENSPETQDEYVKFNQDVKVITELAHKMDGVGFYGNRRPHIVALSRDLSQEPVQLTFGPYRHSQLAISPDGLRLFFTSRYGDDYDREPFEQHIYSLNVSESRSTPQRLSGKGINAYSPCVHPEGSHLFFIGSHTEDLGYDNPSLFVIPLDQPENYRRIAPNWDRPFADESLSDMLGPASNPLCFDHDGSHIFSLTSDKGTVQLARIDWQHDTVELLTRGSHAYYSYDVDPHRSLAILAMNTPTNPSQLVWLDFSSLPTEPAQLTNPNQGLLRSIQLSSPRRFHCRAPEGPEIDGWVLPPVGLSEEKDQKDERKYPAVLAIHGGPMMMYADSFFLEFQWLAQHGYAVIYTNPRGSQGYGRDFCRAIQKEWGHLDYEDIMAGLDTALEKYPWIDKQRLAVAGGSYGGFMTNWIVSHTNRFKAAITMRSVVDWKAMVGTGDGGWHWMRRAGVAPWQADDAWYRRQSPITYVENITTPLLIEHQEGDLRCPIEQGEILYTAVKYLNKAPVKFIRYPGEFHGMSRNGKPWHRIFRLNSFTDWLKEYL